MRFSSFSAPSRTLVAASAVALMALAACGGIAVDRVGGGKDVDGAQLGDGGSFGVGGFANGTGGSVGSGGLTGAPDWDNDGVPDSVDDSDHDGVTDEDELANGFDPTRGNTDGDACSDFAEFTFGECDPSNSIFKMPCEEAAGYGGPNGGPLDGGTSGEITLVRTVPTDGKGGLTIHILPAASDAHSSIQVDLLEAVDEHLKLHVYMTGEPGKHLRTVQVITPSQGVVAEGQVLWMVGSCSQ